VRRHVDLSAACAAALLGACRASEVASPAGLSAPPIGESIVVCGERIPIGAPVVLWTDPGGYSAYSTELRFPEAAPARVVSGLRYRPGREGVPAEGDCRARLAGAIDLLVVHYDACGTSRRCFEVLHDRRGLSAHFLLDLDGTLYQTRDLADTAWHARQANPRSVGVEIANIGAYPAGQASPLEEWYGEDERGVRVTLPSRLDDGGLRTPGFVARPAREGRIEGPVQGELLEMHDYTPEQYESLAHLAAALCRLFPAIEPDAPRGTDGAVRGDALAEGELRAFQGILGHLHVSAEKQDPGPAFDWEGFLARVRQLLRSRPTSASSAG
jgi:N-acetyl-anhydromuramyl-L-alanine amidase AmpD